MLSLANSTNLRHLGNQDWQNEIKSASDWFCQMFPVQVCVFGAPFLEQHQANAYGGASITPLVLNVDCLAACLGGDERLGHSIIYYATELQFYFYDPRDQSYHATTDQKVGNLLRGLLARCANEVKGEGHLVNVFHSFRTDAVIKSIVNRAKSILEADSEFFGVKSQHQRVQGPELHQRLALVFAQQLLEVHESSILTVGQSYALFNRFAATKNMPAIKRTDFKSMMAEVIRDAYGLGVRNDLKNAETQKQQCGWKGLRPVEA
jgi:hypothetical protein